MLLNFCILNGLHCWESREARWRHYTILWMSSQERRLHLRGGTCQIRGRGSPEAACCILAGPGTQGLRAASVGTKWRRGVEHPRQRWTHLCLRVSVMVFLVK